MESEQYRPSRLAIAFVVVGLAFSAIGIAYIIYAGRERELPPIAAVTTAPANDPRIQQLEALLRMVMHSFFLFLTFLFGSYLMLRIGRHVLERKTFHERTEYVDVWASYRLSQDEIDTATAQLDDDFPPDAPPAGDEREPPDTKP